MTPRCGSHADGPGGMLQCTRPVDHPGRHVSGDVAWGSDTARVGGTDREAYLRGRVAQLQILVEGYQRQVERTEDERDRARALAAHYAQILHEGGPTFASGAPYTPWSVVAGDGPAGAE